MTAEPDEVPVWDDAERWREQCLLAAGYPEMAATMIAEDLSIDLHRALDLAAAGCPPVVALRILT